MEGLESDEIKRLPLNRNIAGSEYSNILFRMGEYDAKNKLKVDSGENDFIFIDMKYNLGLMNEQAIENCLNSLHEKDSLNILQTNYIKAKMNLISKDDIKKLIVVNPYTRGLKELMYAFLEKKPEKRIIFYKNALKYLKHIKYYYIEALYYYSLFLKENDSYDNYEETLNKGIELAKKYNYRFLSHNFYCLKNGVKKEYKLEDWYYVKLLDNTFSCL